VIHAAGTAALRAGATVDGVLGVGAALAERLPVVLMCYANLIHARGADAFARDLADRGIAGLIVPDLPLEETPDVLAACDEAGVALVPLVAPTTPDERLARIGARARGFVYAVSVTGTTGERQALDGLRQVLRSAAAHTGVPVAVGFGIARPEQAAEAAAAGADGVIVEVHPNPDEAICDGPQALRAELFGEYAEQLERAAALAGKTLLAREPALA